MSNDTPDQSPDNAPAQAAAPPGPHSHKDCGDALKLRFPALFSAGIKPLKLKIQADIQERAPGEFTKAQLSAFFRRYTGSTPYLIAMTKSPHRFDLDGQTSGDISEEHRAAAQQELARRRALQQDKFQQIEDARRQRAALLRDFETTTLTPANFCALKGIAPQALDALLATARREAAERPHFSPQHPPRHSPERAPRQPHRDRRPQGKRPVR
jgi:sRNA-binding protein